MANPTADVGLHISYLDLFRCVYVCVYIHRTGLPHFVNLLIYINVRRGGSVGVVKGFSITLDTFLPKQRRSGGFWPIRSYVFASYFGNVWFSGARASLTDSRHGNLNFRRVIYFRFRSGSVSGRISTSGIAAELWPPRVRDLRIMEERGRFYVRYLPC